VEIVWRETSLEKMDALTMLPMLELRQQVFVIEQQCIYPDIDAYDYHALHVGGYIDTQLIAYARVLAPNSRYEEASIGRVVTHPDHRQRGLGRQLMQACIARSKCHYPGAAIRISAQAHLQQFYAALGFVACSDIYVEDGIPHVDMIRSD